jgi:hypothetical protein
LESSLVGIWSHNQLHFVQLSRYDLQNVVNFFYNTHVPN